MFYNCHIGCTYTYEMDKTGFSVKEYIDKAMWYDPEEVDVEVYEEIEGRKNTLLRQREWRASSSPRRARSHPRNGCRMTTSTPM